MINLSNSDLFTKEIINLILENNIVLFIGAGISTSSGLPSWNQLIKPLAKEINLDDEYDLSKIAEYYQDRFGRRSLIKHLKKQLIKDTYRHNQLHQILIDFEIKNWITTNYDLLIEQCFNDYGISYNRIINDTDISNKETKDIDLIKWHGDFTDYNSLVITKQDYNRHYISNQLLKKKIEVLLAEKSFLFLGYSLDDSDIIGLFDEFNLYFAESLRKSYAIFLDISEQKIRNLEKKGIKVINLGIKQKNRYTKALVTYLLNISNEIKKFRKQKQKDENQLSEKTITELLESVGYRINDIKNQNEILYFLCENKVGIRIVKDIILYTDNSINVSTVSALSDAINTYNADKGIILTKKQVRNEIESFISEREKIISITIDNYIDKLVDFNEYLESFILDFEKSDIYKYYIPLHIDHYLKDKSNNIISMRLYDYVNNWLKDKSGNHLSILGEFGCGKTWFCNYLMYNLAKAYLKDPSKNRVPILISLRDYSKAYDVEQLLTDVLVNKYKIKLAAGYSTFEKLNKEGRLLVIFDGFDEMERRISDYQTTKSNFWELAKIIAEKSKIVITCRTEYFKHKIEELELLRKDESIKITREDNIIDLASKYNFDLIHVLEFNSLDIKLALEKRHPVKWTIIYDKINKIPSLKELASRPVLLNMIIQTIHQWNVSDNINISYLFKKYIDTLLDRRSEKDTDFLKRKERLYFVKELAWEMYQTQNLSIHFSKIPDRVSEFFNLERNPEKIPFIERDVRTQSYLVRDEDGNYSFAHKSFMEYFVSLNLSDLLETFDNNESKTILVWKELLSNEIMAFLSQMIKNKADLWKLIDYTKGKSSVDVGYAGANSIKLLKLLNEDFTNKDFSNTILNDVDFTSVDLTNSCFLNAKLRNADFVGAVLENCDFSNADLNDVKFGDIKGIKDFAFSSLGKYLAIIGEGGSVKIYNYNNLKNYVVIPSDYTPISGISWHPKDNNIFATIQSNNWIVTVWELTDNKLVIKKQYRISTEIDRGRYLLFRNWISIEQLDLFGNRIFGREDKLDHRYIKEGIDLHKNESFKLSYYPLEYTRHMTSELFEDFFNMKASYINLAYATYFLSTPDLVITPIHFSQDGNFIIVINNDGSLTKIDYKNGLHILIDTKYDPIIWFNLINDGTTILLLTYSNKLLKLNLKNGKISILKSKIESISLTPFYDKFSKQIFNLVFDKNHLKLINIENNDIFHICKFKYLINTKIVFLNKYRNMIFGTNDSRLIIYNLLDCKVQNWKKEDIKPRIISINPNEDMVAVGYKGSEIVKILKIDEQDKKFEKKVIKINVGMNCNKMKIEGATGLDDYLNEDFDITIGDWLIERGAIK